jgi:hypothetical protein
MSLQVPRQDQRYGTAKVRLPRTHRLRSQGMCRADDAPFVTAPDRETAPPRPTISSTSLGAAKAAHHLVAGEPWAGKELAPSKGMQGAEGVRVDGWVREARTVYLRRWHGPVPLKVVHALRGCGFAVVNSCLLQLGLQRIESRLTPPLARFRETNRSTPLSGFIGDPKVRPLN